MIALALLAAVASGMAQEVRQGSQIAPTMSMGGMAHMDGHMYMTTLRTLQPGDKAKADAIVAAAKEAMAPYTDYHKALDDGFHIFLPNIPQPQYHFTKNENGRAALTQFDPLKPTSLLYKKTPDGGYKLVGAMYTDRVTANEDELNERIPLSIAHWHQHVNFCKAPAGHVAEYFGHDAKYGLMGAIHTREECEVAGGTFLPHVFGWMVHVYPYETDPAKVWSTGDDDAGHGNMDHAAMPGMEMK
ncbi:MAG: hypothetical protein ABSF28_06405 [Terracidiphilus sp.]|jgi:hypothetical protein